MNELEHLEKTLSSVGEKLYFDDQPLHFKNLLPNVENFLTWNDVEYCVNNENFKFEVINKRTSEKHSDLRNYVDSKRTISGLINDGHCFVIFNYDSYVEKANALLSTIEKAIGGNWFIHVYGGLHGAKSFAIHMDNPPNLIIQTDGRTDWVVYENRSSRVFPPGIPQGAEKYMREKIKVTLEPGDALYIPANTYHVAKPTGQRLSMSLLCDNFQPKKDRNIYSLDYK